MAPLKTDSVLLASGGLDSTTLAYWLHKRKIHFIPVFINYGQHCAQTELETLVRVLPPDYARRVQVIDAADVYRGCDSLLIRETNLWKNSVDANDLHLPYRNLLLLTLGAAFTQSRHCSFLYAAFINSNHAKELDCSAKFFNQLSKVLLEYGSIEIKMPFRNMPKKKVARIGVQLGVPIGYTFSCQAASRVPCGACPNCVDRLEAIRSLSR